MVASSFRFALAALGVAALASSAASASSFVEAYATGGSNPFGSVGDSDTEIGAHGVVATVVAAVTLGGPIPPAGLQEGLSGAYASATEGSLRASASSGARSGPTVQNAITMTASARAQWSDSILVDAPGLTGQSGTLTASIILTGSFAAELGPVSSLDFPLADALVRLLGTGLVSANVTMLDPTLAAICGGWALCGRSVADVASAFAGSNIPGTITVSIPIQFGSSTGIGYTLDVYARANASSFAGGSGTDASASSDYGSTLRWGGILAVLDSNGTAVTDYVTSSASGFDYAAVVPEANALALLAIGLLGLSAIGRQHRKL